jgi:hypothetical protein
MDQFPEGLILPGYHKIAIPAMRPYLQKLLSATTPPSRLQALALDIHHSARPCLQQTRVGLSQ